MESKKEKVIFVKQDLAVSRVRNYRKIPALQHLEDKLFEARVENCIKEEVLLQIEASVGLSGVN